MKHRWVKDEKGNIKDFQCGDFHSGPMCAECGANPCRYCNPDCYDEECEGRCGFKMKLLTPFRYVGKPSDDYGSRTCHTCRVAGKCSGTDYEKLEPCGAYKHCEKENHYVK